MDTVLDDFLKMIPQTYSLFAHDPYAAFMKGKEICTTDGEALVRWVEAHNIREKVERTGEVYSVRKGRQAGWEYQRVSKN